MIESLLTTKYTMPPLRAALVARARLDAKIQQALRMPFTLVSAPPGFGKTTAVLSALHHRDLRATQTIAWLSLDTRDNDPTRFWQGVAAALQHVGLSSAASLGNASPAQIPAVLTETLNEIAARETPLIFVLDDFHLIEHPEIHAGAAFLGEHLPPTLHWVIITRADPPWPLHRQRARGQLAEIRAHDLRFETDEAIAFLRQVMGVTLDTADAARLITQTEGWAAGLQLAGLALQADAHTTRDHAALLERLAHSNRYVLEYLTEEVLAQQPAELQSFLLQTSILNPLCGELCDAMLERHDSAALLETLTRRNLFMMPIAADDARGWYRYHPLFAGLLQAQLQQHMPQHVAALHQRAAHWHAQHHHNESAIEHGMHAHDYGLVARLLEERADQMVMAGHVLTLEHWLNQLPPAWLQPLARANLAFAWALLIRGRYGEIAAYLQRAQQAIPADARPLWSQYHALSASLADTSGDAGQAYQHAQRALEYAQADAVNVRASAYVALGGALRTLGDTSGAVAAYEQAIPLCQASKMPLPELLSRAHLGMLYAIQGRLHRAESVTRPALQTAARNPATSAAHTALADVLLAWNRLDEAEQHIEQAAALTEQSGHRAASVHVHLLRSKLRRARGDSHGAHAALDAAIMTAAQGVPSWITPLLTAERVEQWLEQGAVESAAAFLNQQDGEALAGHVREVLPIARAQVLYHQSRLAEARALLDSVLRTAESAGHYGRAIHGRLWRALIHTADDHHAAASADLRQALALAEPEGYVRVFLNCGAKMATLLAVEGSAYARRLLAHFPDAMRTPTGRDSASHDGLTERELEVLRFMADGLTYQQIADTLIVSINTVRHHVKSIYSKLNAENRTQAITNARAQDLL